MSRSILVLLVIPLLMFVSLNTFSQTKRVTWSEKPKLYPFQEGIVCPNSTRIKYKIEGKTRAIIKLSEPVVIAMADDEEPWGYYQFPSIGRDENGVLKIGWSMIKDSHETYGQKTKRKESNERVSFDGGRTWRIPEKEYNTYRRAYNLFLSNGDYITVDYPAA